MDLSDDDFERPSRASPRLKSKKCSRKNLVDGFVSDSESENRATKRRKKVRRNTKDPKAKQNIGFKCCPHLLFDLVRNLDTDQRKWVDEIGFAVFLSTPSCRLPKDLTVWLVNQCSWTDKALVVRGRPIKIKPFIKKLLGIPDGPYAVPLPRSKRGKAKWSTEDENELKEDKGARSLSYKSTLESLLGTHDPEQFKRAFMLYVLCIYLAPSSGHFVNLSYSPIVNNVDIIKEMNWCDHVADVLIEGIREYRDSKAANVNVHGCVHVLLLIYIDVVKSAILKVPHGFPRAKFVTTDMLELLDMADLKCRAADGPVYGKLELDNSKWTDEGDHANNSTSSLHDGGVNESSGVCSNSLPDIHVDKSFLNGIMEIDDHYEKARDQVYADFFKVMSEMIAKLDAERSAAISSLHGKLYSAKSDAPSVPEHSIPLKTSTESLHPSYGGCSRVVGQAQVCQKNKEPAATIPGCDTPYKISSLTSSSSQAHLLASNIVQSPVELSLQRHTPKIVNNAHPLLQRTEISPDRGHTMETGNGCSPGSIDGRQGSVDLQNNCLQLSTIVVSKAETERIIKSCRIGRTRRLFPEQPVIHMEIPSKDVPHEDDPMGFDIMKEVSSIGKEASNQAIKDNGPLITSPLKCFLSHLATSDDDAPAAGCTKQPGGKTANVNPVTAGCTEGPIEGKSGQEILEQADASICPPMILNVSSTTALAYQTDCGSQPHHDNSVTEAAENSLPREEPIFQPASFSIAGLSNPHAVDSPPPSTIETQGDLQAGDDSVYIPDYPGHDGCSNAGDVQTVVSPIINGEFFDGAGSVNTAVKARAKRFGRSEDTIDGIAQLTKPSSVLKAVANKTYIEHVESSKFWSTERKSLADPARNCGGQTKIRIRGVHVSEEEFVHTLKPGGHVDSNFMWLLSVAIMLDWNSKSRTIFNPSIIRELMKPHSTCDHEKVALKLKMLPLDKIDQLYLPVPNNQHWVLVLITISSGTVEIYDSLRTCRRGDDPYEDMWKTIGYNLQISFSYTSVKSVLIHDKYKKQYAQIQTQDNKNESGLEVSRILVCHNGKDLIGYGKVNMASYRKEVAHILVYHRFNDLNPRRDSPIIPDEH